MRARGWFLRAARAAEEAAAQRRDEDVGAEALGARRQERRAEHRLLALARLLLHLSRGGLGPSFVAAGARRARDLGRELRGAHPRDVGERGGGGRHGALRKSAEGGRLGCWGWINRDPVGGPVLRGTPRRERSAGASVDDPATRGREARYPSNTNRTLPRTKSALPALAAPTTPRRPLGRRRLMPSPPAKKAQLPRRYRHDPPRYAVGRNAARRVSVGETESGFSEPSAGAWAIDRAPRRSGRGGADAGRGTTTAVLNLEGVQGVWARRFQNDKAKTSTFSGRTSRGMDANLGRRKNWL